MESMDNLRERVEALEQQLNVTGAQTRMVERRLRWWRSLTCGVLLVGLVSLPLPSGLAKRSTRTRTTRDCRSVYRCWRNRSKPSRPRWLSHL